MKEAIYKSRFTAAGVLFMSLFLFLIGSGWRLPAGTIAIRGGEIHAMEGKVVGSGTILIRDGKIVEIGEAVQIPQDAEIIDAKGYLLYPGFIAASGFFASVENRNFESLAPDASALDRFDFYADYSLLIRRGITSAFVSLPANRLIAGKGDLVKLGAPGLPASVLKPDAALALNLVREAVLPPMTDIFPAPVSTQNPLVPSIRQYPASNLGAYWLLTELLRPEPYSGDLAKYYGNISGALREIQSQGRPLIVRCRTASEIRQAVDLAKMLKMPLIILAAAEALEALESIKAESVSLIVEAGLKPNGYYPGGDLSGAADLRKPLAEIAGLVQRGIPLALATDDEKYLPDLFWIAQYFQKFGISREDLFKTITINPARIFGLDDRVGSLTKGRDADILFFKEAPGKPLPRLERVMIEGRIVHEEK